MSWERISAGLLTCSVVAIMALVDPRKEELKISSDGMLFIAEKEGCRRGAYECAASVVTIGIGHTTNANTDHLVGDKQIAKWFVSDIQKAESAVLRQVNLPQGPVHDMAVSFVFNLGAGNFRDSTFLKKLKAGDYPSACLEFPRWVYVSGRDCRVTSSNCSGIVTRREQEKEICLNGYS